MAKKTVRKKLGTRKAAPRKKAGARPRRKGPTKQALRKRIQTKVQRKLAQGVKIARQLEKQNLTPDEIAAGVRAKLEGLGDDVITDILKLVGGSIHVQMPT